MNAFTALETALAEPLDAAIHIDAKDKDPVPELQRQAELVATIKRTFTRAKVAAVPNGGMRGQKALNQARREGAWWGFVDLIVIGPAPLVAFLEMKNGSEMPRQNQVDALNALHRMGHRVGVFRRADSAIAWLRRQGF